MNTDLTQEQIHSYRQNGFVVLHDFLTSDELDSWRQAVDGAVRQRGKRGPDSCRFASAQMSQPSLLSLFHQIPGAGTVRYPRPSPLSPGSYSYHPD